MDDRKHEAIRALDLLEQYYNRLNSPGDEQLKNAINRLIQVFKSRLFQALIDIHEFYYSTLLNDQTNGEQKTRETDLITSQLQNITMINRNRPVNGKSGVVYSQVSTVGTENPVFSPLNKTEQDIIRPTLDRLPSQTTGLTDRIDNINTSTNIKPVASNKSADYSYDDHWTQVKIDLERPPNTGLGFSIAGGSDNPCIGKSPAIVVSRVVQDGLVYNHGVLKLHDIILRVNDIDFTCINRSQAVEALRAAGNHVHLVVRRLAPQSLEQIILAKPPDTNLGFSIAGGITYEHVKGDFGLFITNIVPGGIADKSGRLKIGDRLLSVQSGENVYDLDFIEHSRAIQIIRRICSEGSKITLTVAHIIQNASPAEISPRFDATEHDPTTENGQHKEPKHIPFEPIVPAGQRIVTLNRSHKGFGFNIITVDGRTFMSQILPEGPAKESAQLYRGDEILSVNDVAVQDLIREEVASIINNCGPVVELRVVYNNDDYQLAATGLSYQSDTLERQDNRNPSYIPTRSERQFYIKAKVDYDPTKDLSLSGNQGLAFHAGDILHVVNAADDNWWQARRVISEEQEDGELGTIPSQSRLERKERARRKRVNFNHPSGESPKGTKKTKKISNSSKTRGKRDTQAAEDSDTETENLEPIISYEILSQYQIDYTRPIVILGPFTALLNVQLISEDPEKFIKCVPYTSRPKRADEVDGEDRIFVQSRQAMQQDINNDLFIEVGEFNGHFYGTKFDDVHSAINQSKHCLLNIQRVGIQRLISAGLAPIVILIKAPTVDWILGNMGANQDEAEAQEMFVTATRQERELTDLITAKIEGRSLHEVYQRILATIDREQSRPAVWYSPRRNIQ